MKKFGTYLCLILFLFACSKQKENSSEQILKPTSTLGYLDLSANYLLNQQNENGFFNYEYDFISGTNTPWDNIIHQTKTTYVLTQYYAFLKKENIHSIHTKQILSAIRTSLDSIKKNSLQISNQGGKLFSFYYRKNNTPDLNIEDTDQFREERINAEIKATAFALLAELTYWETTNLNDYEDIRLSWLKALLYYAQSTENLDDTSPVVWQALATYHTLLPENKDIQDMVEKYTNLFLNRKFNLERTEDLLAILKAIQQDPLYQIKPEISKILTNYISNFLEKTQHDSTTNSCDLSVSLIEMNNVLKYSTLPNQDRLNRAILARAQMEFYNALKFVILPEQKWITLGPGRTLNSTDFKRHTGAVLEGTFSPKTNLYLSSTFIEAGLNFTKEDLQEYRDSAE